ncbi:hypothetical protein B0J11DRAFT_302911 [Dendryphion nanum]|uniref:Uncharacterized protein n=1 Tax=Dendryphion nanum TaxID=256645 RepID=A0A9P9DVK5_9PLEO|nr:hypothetical protein B0J11DRAFT_302911 [Dendryphion nanum]
MDPDDAIPPPIRRSHRQTTQLQDNLSQSWLNQDNDDLDDEAVPPPINRRRSVSLGNTIPFTTSINPPVIPPIPRKSPLRTQPVPSPTQSSIRSLPARNFSQPFKDLLRKPTPTAQSRGPAPYRGPVRSSYRNNPLRPSLRRWSSLETIESVTTTPSIHGELPEPDHVSISTDGSTGCSIVEEEHWNSSAQQDTLPSVLSSAESSDTAPSRLASTSTLSKLMVDRSNSSLMRKLKPSRKFKEPLVQPEHLRIERTISFDQTSHRTTSSSSIMTISSGRPSEIGHTSSVASQRSDGSQDSKNWRASEYDISGLSEADLKKCKKKGINPALYAEMKAAKKGKWISPIGGNTIL